MCGGKRYVLIFSFLLIYFVDKCVQNDKPSKRKERHFLPLLGYLQGYKTAQNYLHYPSYFFPPIIILPSVTQQQAVNIQKSYSDESYQENGGIFQYIQSAKLILNSDRDNNSKANDNNCENYTNDDNDIARQAAAHDTSEKQNTPSSRLKPVNYHKIKHENNAIIETVTNSTGNNNLTTMENKNTTAISTDLVLPTNQSHNFTTATYDNATIIINPTTLTNGTDNDFNSEFNLNETYPNAWYNNDLVDKISLTTPQDEESMSKNDGWDSEASINSASGFRPLAGLYYDGFLDKPVVKRSEFAPVKSKSNVQFFTLK